MTRKHLKVVRLLEPDLCFDCPFAERAKIETLEGSLQQVVRCRRKDCDNWDYNSVEDPIAVFPESA